MPDYEAMKQAGLDLAAAVMARDRFIEQYGMEHVVTRTAEEEVWAQYNALCVAAGGSPSTAPIAPHRSDSEANRKGPF